MQLRDFPIPDFGDLANGLSRGNSAPAVVTLEIEWTSSGNKQHFRNSDLGFDRRVVFNSAVVSWKAQTQTATFVSNPASQSLVHAEVGHERNGVFFS